MRPDRSLAALGMTRCVDNDSRNQVDVVGCLAFDAVAFDAVARKRTSQGAENDVVLERFPFKWNRSRFHLNGNARADDVVSPGTFRSADSSRTECALDDSLLA